MTPRPGTLWRTEELYTDVLEIIRHSERPTSPVPLLPNIIFARLLTTVCSSFFGAVQVHSHSLLSQSERISMATQGSDDNLVESLAIPSSIKDIYTEACKNDQSIAESLSIPSDRISATMLVQGRGREVIAKIEELSLNNPIRKERRLKQYGIRPALQVFSSGVNIVGQPYMAIIPFYIKGKVTLGEETVQLDRYYHVYGESRLVIEDNAKLGIWGYKLGS